MFAVFSRLSIQTGIESLIAKVNIIVIGASVILVLFTCLSSFMLAKNSPKASFLIFIPLSLLIYPGCLAHYAVLMLPILFEILSLKEKASLKFFIVFTLVLVFSSFLASLLILISYILYSFLDVPIFTSLKITMSNTL
jgi:hypothetical protein